MNRTFLKIRPIQKKAEPNKGRDQLLEDLTRTSRHSYAQSSSFLHISVI